MRRMTSIILYILHISQNRDQTHVEPLCSGRGCLVRRVTVHSEKTGDFALHGSNGGFPGGELGVRDALFKAEKD